MHSVQTDLNYIQLVAGPQYYADKNLRINNMNYIIFTYHSQMSLPLSF